MVQLPANARQQGDARPQRGERHGGRVPQLPRIQLPWVLLPLQDSVPEASPNGLRVYLPVLDAALVLPWHVEEVNLPVAEDKLVDLQAQLGRYS